MTYSGKNCETCGSELTLVEVANLGCSGCADRRNEEKQGVEKIEHFNARVLQRTGEILQNLPVRFVPVGDGLRGQIVARRGHAMVIDERESEDSPAQYVLNFIGVNPMNVHYTSLPSGACSSGYTLSDAGVYPASECRAEMVVIPARVFELAMLFYDQTFGFDHRSWDDEAAKFAADFYMKSEGDMVPEYECEHCSE